MRTRISPIRYVYPDFSVARGQPRLEDEKELTLLNPVFVVEATSPSSATRDRVKKLDNYFDALSIEAYSIINQVRPRADLYRQTQEGCHLRAFSNAEDVIPLPMLDCQLPLAQVYRGIVFDKTWSRGFTSSPAGANHR